MKHTLKRAGALLLAVLLAFSLMPAVYASSEEPSSEPSAEPAPSAEASAEASAESSFREQLEALYIDPDRVYSSDVRWWLGSAAATDDSLLEEIQALYDAGFRGAELCMQSDSAADNATYAYGSDMWSHKWKLMMNALLDLGMGVYLTSGTNWATSNVPVSELDPDSQEAMQIVVMPSTASGAGGVCDPILTAGESISEPLQTPPIIRGNTALLGVYAYEINEDGCFLYGTDIDLLAADGAVTQVGDSATDYLLTWTAPTDGIQGKDARYQIITMWTQGSYETSSPGAETCYTTNYFDERGVEALRRFWEKYYLDDPELNAKILEGDVQLFMDSLEIRYGESQSVNGSSYAGGIGFTWWAEDAREEFIARKGYDILPYLFLIRGISVNFAQAMDVYYDTDVGYYDLADDVSLREKIINDWQSFLTELYEERMLLPLKEWLNSVGIKTRAQISYGKPFEITEPSAYVDYPEAENLNQYDQADIFRLHTAGSKLLNKVLSTETGGTDASYGTSFDIFLRHAYSEYALGFQRVIWHIWTTEYGYGNYAWPGYMSGFSGFYRWGTREPAYRDYDEFNAHIGRVQQLMQTGRSRTDIGFVYNNWTQGMKSGAENHTFAQNDKNWMWAHEGVHYRSTELQDNGYTYDYFSPEFLFNDEVYFDPDTKTIESAGYQALVIFQDWLDADAAIKILELAKQGLPVVIVDGAAVRTPFNDGRDDELAAVMEELKAEPTVRVAKVADPVDYGANETGGFDDEVYEKLLELGVMPYAGFPEENHQLLTQSREDADGNRYLYVYNYCPDDYHQYSSKEDVRLESHGREINTEIRMKGHYIPYEIDAWTGEVAELAEYRYEDGVTVIPVDLEFGRIALYAFEKTDAEKTSIVYTDAYASYVGDDGLYIRAAADGPYAVQLSDGGFYSHIVEGLPEAYDITGWDLTVQSWTAGEPSGEMVRTETIDGVTTENRKTATVVTEIPVQLDTLTTWDQIPEVGKEVSGLGHYEASFQWDAFAADGAYLDFGDSLEESMKVWINGVKVGGDFSANPTKAQASVGAEIGDGCGGTYIPEGAKEYTGGINWLKPIVDIGEYLVDGENTIVIEYSSSLTNVMLARGSIRTSSFASGGAWWDIDVDYRANGPAQAVIIPYVDMKVDEGAETADLADVEAELAEDTFVYSGEAFEPEVTSVKLGGKTLKEGADYTVSYVDNVEAGQGKVLITGTGLAYGGTKVLEFTIDPINLSGATLAADDMSYTGSALTPEVTVTLDGRTLEANIDYIVSYENNVDVGDAASLTVIGKGNYTGRAETTFAILPVDISTLRIELDESSGEPGAPAVTVSMGGFELQAGVFMGATYLTEGTDFTVTFENGASGEITAVVTGIGNYTGTAGIPYTVE